MLRALLTVLVMVATTCLVFGALGILSWQMTSAVLLGSGIGAVLARVRLSGAGRPVSGTSRTGSA